MEKHWGASVPSLVLDKIKQKLKLENTIAAPVVELNSKFAAVLVERGPLVMASLCSTDVQVLYLVESLNRLFHVLAEYFGQIDEQTICSNLVAVMQITSFFCDGSGRTCISDIHSIREMMTNAVPNIPMNQVGGWRRAGIKYDKPSITVMMNELVDFVVRRDGKTAFARLKAEFLCQSALSDFPTVKFRFKDLSSNATICSLHPSARLYGQMMEFTPPDGTFKLCEALFKQKPHCPISIDSFFVEMDGARHTLKLNVRPIAGDISQFQLTCKGLGTNAEVQSCTVGTATIQQGAAVWTIPKLTGVSGSISISFEAIPCPVAARISFLSPQCANLAGLEVTDISVSDQRGIVAKAFSKLGTTGALEYRLL